MFLEKETRGASSIGISITAVDLPHSDKYMKAKFENKPVIKLSATIDGKKTSWNNRKAPAVLSLYYQPTEKELEDPEHIPVWYMDGKGKVSSVSGGKYDASTGKITFEITHF